MALCVGGLVPLTTIDFPGHLAAVIFCQGCPWRCRYCHNHDLRSATRPAEKAWDDVLAFLDKRRGYLDGVVFSGGEPLMQDDLPAAICAIRGMGYAVALHTAGVSPEKLETALPLLDWVGFDLKAPVSKYERITGVAASAEAARQSLALLKSSGIPYEVRTTVDPRTLDFDDILSLASELADLRERTWVLQECRDPKSPQRILAPSISSILAETSFADKLFSLIPNVTIRAAA